MKDKLLVAKVFCLLFVICAVIAQAATAHVYPLKKSANGRYLVDQNNTPFLITGDSPQSVIVNLSEADAETYFADRQAHGFNTVWINLLCNTYTFGRSNGSTLDGTLPFTGMIPSTSSYDLSKTNEAYFAHVDRVLTLAANHGLLVVLDPIETGGWLNTMADNGTNRCRAYGQYLGNRYGSFSNILWISGNDYQSWSNRNTDAVVMAVALGIKDVDTSHIHTIELNYRVSGSLDDTNWAPIINLNASYTYFPTYAQVLTDYNRANFQPTFMAEANYEFENDWINNASGRLQEYWTLLSGAAGQMYGNHYTSQFINQWQSNLDTPGAIQLGYAKALFAPRRWYDLVPDQNHTVVIAGYGTFSSTGSINSSDYATAARTADGALAMAYLPTKRTVTVDMTQLNAPATARWYDPSRGTYVAISGSPFSNTGTQNFTPSGTNGDGNSDWVLLLESTAPVVTPFGITSVAVQGNDVLLAWTTTGGSTNVVQVTNGDVAGNYTNSFADLSPPIIPPGTGATATSYLDSGGATNQPARYYRIRHVQ
jgi:hypothetical protein